MGLTMRRKPPFDKDALRCIGFRTGVVVYHARRVGSTRDVLVELSVERVAKLRGAYWDRAVAVMQALLRQGACISDFPEEMRGA